MSTNFPNSIDSFPAPGATLASNPHSSLHQNEGDAIAAIEAKVGVNSSAVTSSLDYLVKNASSVSPGHKHVTADLTDAGAFIPTGTIISSFGSSTPLGGFLPCDGSAISRTTYAALFSLIGTAYGSGNGATTFNVPIDFNNSYQGYTFDAVSSKTQASGTSVSLSHTVGGTDSVLVVLFVEGGGTGNVSSVQYGGVNMTTANGSRTGVNFYYMLAPAAGTANITASLTSAAITVVAASFRGFSKPTYFGGAVQDYNGSETKTILSLARVWPSLAVSLIGTSDNSGTAPTLVIGNTRVSLTSGANSNAAIADIQDQFSSAVWSNVSATFTILYLEYFTGINTANLRYNYIKI